MIMTSDLFLLAALLLLTPCSCFVPNKGVQIKPTASTLLSTSSSDENNYRLNELNKLIANTDNIENKFIVEPNDDNLPIPQDTSPTNEETDYTAARSVEFNLSDDKAATPTPRRKARLELESRLASIYTPVNSNAYWDLQDTIVQLTSDLEMAKSQLSHKSHRFGSESAGIKAIETMLRRAQAKDAEHVYRVTTQAARVAERMGRHEEAERYDVESGRARMMLPQFQLEGLWVGKYGSHGFEMINVTYSGDQLVAYKVTGDQNIPRGEISFTADLSPPGYSSSFDHETAVLEPIALSEGSAKKWGTRRLPRYPGQGHAAEPNYQNPQYLEGQLVVIGPGDYFSFAWIPLEHQIFFGRPSPELTLKMLREGGSASLTAGMGVPVPSLDNGNLREVTDYVTRCMEVTNGRFEDEQCEGKASEWCNIWHGDENEEFCHFQ